MIHALMRQAEYDRGIRVTLTLTLTLKWVLKWGRSNVLPQTWHVRTYIRFHGYDGQTQKVTLNGTLETAMYIGIGKSILFY